VTPAFGRTLAFANMEYAHPVYTTLHGTVAVAGFVDTARASDRLSGAADGRVHVDIGAGLRVGSAAFGGSVRLDVGYGLRDGTHKFSAG
jgi:outer membrane translocation and assembly module TamA